MSKRIPRVNALIQREVSQLLLREIEFPINVLVTLTRAETLSDLSESNIWISVLPEEKNKIVFEILKKNIYTLQQKLNKKLRMRPIPRIVFREEKKTSEAGKIEEVLEKLKKEEK